MLLSQNRSRHKKCYLLSILNCFKSRTDSNFGFTITNISANKAIHNPVTFHICLGICYSIQLIFCFFKHKHFLEFLLPDSIFSKWKSLFLLSDGIQFHQFFSHFTHGTLYFGFRFGPFFTSQFIQLRVFSISGSIFLNHIQSGCRNIQISSIPVFNLNIIFNYPLYFHLFNSTINTQSMSFVNYIIPYVQLGKIFNLSPLVLGFLVFLFLLISKNITFRNYYKF